MRQRTSRGRGGWGCSQLLLLLVAAGTAALWFSHAEGLLSRERRVRAAVTYVLRAAEVRARNAREALAEPAAGARAGGGSGARDDDDGERRALSVAREQEAAQPVAPAPAAAAPPPPPPAVSSPSSTSAPPSPPATPSPSTSAPPPAKASPSSTPAAPSAAKSEPPKQQPHQQPAPGGGSGEKEIVSSARCHSISTGAEGGASSAHSPIRRVCVLTNVCIDTDADTSTHATRHDRLVFYAGSKPHRRQTVYDADAVVPLARGSTPSPSPHPPGPCIAAAGVGPDGYICAGDRVAQSGSLNHANFVLIARVEAEGAPAAAPPEAGPRGVVWRPEPAMILSRHYPNNLAHTITDDIFPLFKLAARELGWDPASGTNTAYPGGNITAVLVDSDILGNPPWLLKLYPTLLPGITPVLAGTMFPPGTTMSPELREARVVRRACFAGPVLLGVGDTGMMRNPWHAYGRLWAYANDEVDWARMQREHDDFAAHFRRALGLPPLAAAPASALVAVLPATPAVGGDGSESSLPPEALGLGRPLRVLLINRQTRAFAGSELRGIANIGAVETEVRRVVEAGATATKYFPGSIVTLMDWMGRSHADNAATADGADVVVSLHGAGNMWQLASRPGSAWVELFPPRGTPSVGVYRALAGRQRLRYYALTVAEAACNPALHFQQQPSFTADADAVAGMVAQVLEDAVGDAVAAARERRMAAASSAAAAARLEAFGAALSALQQTAAAEDAAADAAGWEALVGPAVAALPPPSPRPAFSPSLPTAQRGSVVILAPPEGKGVVRSLGNARYVQAAMAQVMAEDARRHLEPLLEAPSVETVVSVLGAGAGPNRSVTLLQAAVASPLSAAGVAAAVAAVRGADLVIAVHGTGVLPLMAAAAPGAAWLDLLPPRAHAAFPQYYAAARAASVRLHTLMLKERDCNASAYGQPVYDADTSATAAVAALAIRAEI